MHAFKPMASGKLKIFIVDDDQDAVNVERMILESAGYEVSVGSSSSEALVELEHIRPDCILLDIMMPDVDGLELLQSIRERQEFRHTKIVMVSGKPYEYDKTRAFELGANGFVLKPFEPKEFLGTLETIIQDQIELRYWGVRGTLPSPGEHSLKYGGNTSCVTLSFPDGQFFIFDAGTGIKSLSNHLLATGKTRIEGKIFISHPHWDHINALPFFAPLFIAGNEFEIFGGAQGDMTVEKIISSQMDGVYFPIKVREFAARVHYRDLKEESLEVAGIRVDTMLLSHPGFCLGYRIQYGGRSICYITDNELFPQSSGFFNENYRNNLTGFMQDADVVITDTTYTDEEYVNKIGWGHSPVSEVVALADQANVKSLHLFHHDPDQNDDAIDAKLETATALLDQCQSATKCLAPAEGDIFKI